MVFIMAFGEELAKIDLDKIAEIFDDVFPPTELPTGVEANDREFIENEVAKSDVQYPVFQAIDAKFKDVAPTLLISGVSQERVHGMMIGMHITQLMLSNYAEREIPDTFLPEDEPGA